MKTLTTTGASAVDEYLSNIQILKRADGKSRSFRCNIPRDYKFRGFDSPRCSALLNLPTESDKQRASAFRCPECSALMNFRAQAKQAAVAKSAPAPAKPKPKPYQPISRLVTFAERSKLQADYIASVARQEGLNRNSSADYERAIGIAQSKRPDLFRIHADTADGFYRIGY